MKNKIFLILTFAIMLVFAGCSDGGGGGGTTPSGDTFRGGTKALVLNFENGAPPEKVLDNKKQAFAIRMKVQNEGETDVLENEARVVVTGIDPSLFLFSSENPNHKKLGKITGFKQRGSTTQKGGQAIAAFNGLRYNADINSGTRVQNFLVDMCYPYATRAFGEVCINGKASYQDDSSLSVCKLQEGKKTSNSGAPVFIENLEQVYGENDHSIIINFEIVHSPKSAKTILFKKDSLSDLCRSPDGTNPDENIEIKDQVYYEIKTEVGGKKFKCDGTESNSGTVMLADNRYLVSCTLDTEGQGEYVKPIEFVLKYDYLERYDKSFKVEHYGN